MTNFHSTIYTAQENNRNDIDAFRRHLYDQTYLLKWKFASALFAKKGSQVFFYLHEELQFSPLHGSDF